MRRSAFGGLVDDRLKEGERIVRQRGRNFSAGFIQQKVGLGDIVRIANKGAPHCAAQGHYHNERRVARIILEFKRTGNARLSYMLFHSYSTIRVS